MLPEFNLCPNTKMAIPPVMQHACTGAGSCFGYRKPHDTFSVLTPVSHPYCQHNVQLLCTGDPTVLKKLTFVTEGYRI